MNDVSNALSGVWSGRFNHDDEDRDGASISAWINVSEDRLSGSTLEPNTFVDSVEEELDCLLRGHVSGDEVVFLKTYQGLDQEPVYCEGTIADDGHRIVGKWYYGWPDEQSGTFEISREHAKSATTARRQQNANS